MPPKKVARPRGRPRKVLHEATPENAAPQKVAPKKARTGTSKPIVLMALTTTIENMPECQLRDTMKLYCEKIPELRKGLEQEFLVPGKDVVRYHADTASEDESNNELSSESENESSDNGSVIVTSKARRWERRPIETGDDELAERWAKCENCGCVFDVTKNERGDCIWHPGHGCWEDFDRGRRDISDVEDDPAYASGFQWNCCEEDGSCKGCKSTKHKASIIANTIETVGEKEVYHRRNFWCDHDDGCHERLETLLKSSDFEGGMIWPCCEKDIDEDGCEKSMHFGVGPWNSHGAYRISQIADPLRLVNS
ncbi:hypothetical protein BDZ45DRAFT_733290 [Acephala macrosclerotiorum]|nr:hypothetical protein BDZ45DRAFT_733290 [Acephala macrosclerotiorum]